MLGRSCCRSSPKYPQSTQNTAETKLRSCLVHEKVAALMPAGGWHTPHAPAWQTCVGREHSFLLCFRGSPIARHGGLPLCSAALFRRSSTATKPLRRAMPKVHSDEHRLNAHNQNMTNSDPCPYVHPQQEQEQQQQHKQQQQQQTIYSTTTLLLRLPLDNHATWLAV